jgi:phosphate transport system substrate-binding protein
VTQNPKLKTQNSKPKTIFDMKKFLFALSVMACFSMACKNNTSSSNKSDEPLDTPTGGKTTVSVDETVRPIAEAQAAIFQHQYPRATVTLRHRSENDCVQDLYNDSAQVIMIGRSLTAKEMAAFNSITFTPPHIKIATDAVALVINPKNRDTTLTMEEISGILRGSLTKWSQLGGGVAGDVTLVFDNANSGTVSHLLLKTGVTAMPKNAFAAKSNLEVINYVSTHENAIGVIGWSWISDSDDPTTRQYLQKTRLVSVAPAGGKEFCKPYQLNLAQGKYPLSREVFMIQRERRSGLAGFTSFIHGEIGQLIMLKAGLYPANQDERNIEIVTKPIGKVTK